ncbi:MAG TPA: hypothetical protein VHN37_10650 [Actinomycetota bacterium]|nr:hypothetical protein [Actinomycetota bacterium]
MDIRRTDLDGLETFWAEGDGPARAWLVFRVGALDETLLTRGISRLAAGVALEGVDDGSAAYGSFAGVPTTTFELDGTRDEVISVLRHVWGRLASPRAASLEPTREREIRYSGWRVPDGIDQLLALRFGPRGAGLAGQPELGLHHVDWEAVGAWTERFFVPRNAALALVNVSPDDVRLPSRSQGEWQPPPGPGTARVPLPAWSEDRAGDAAAASILPGTGAADAFASAAAERLRRRLGAGYEVGVAAVRLWPGLDHVAIHCTFPGGSGEDVPDAYVAVVEDLASDGPTAGEIAARHERLREWRASPESVYSRLEWAPQRHVLDPSGATPDALDETDPPAPEAAAEAAREFASTSLYLLPPGAGMPSEYHHLPRSSPGAIEGNAYARADGDASASLVVGEEGVSMTRGARRVTIRFDACEAAASWPDGTVDLYGSDGFGAQIRPHEWVDGASALEAVRTRLTGRTVTMRRPRAAS